MTTQSDNSSVVGIVNQIFIYPIKSCRGISVDKVNVSDQGIFLAENDQVFDRKWMIVKSDGSFITQRQNSKIALMNIAVDKDHLIISAPGKNDLKVPIKNPANKITSRFYINNK
jgi:uncharacterized protein